MTVERELNALVSDLVGDDARAALVAYRRLTQEYLPWLERRAVLAGRRHGLSWFAIGKLLQRSRQSLQQRFSRAFEVSELVAPTRPTSSADLAFERWLAVKANPGIASPGDDDEVVAW